MRFAVNVTAKLAERRSVRLPVSAALLLSAGKQSEHLDKVKVGRLFISHVRATRNQLPATEQANLSHGTEDRPEHRSDS